MSAEPPAFRDRLREELVAAARRDRRRARRRLVIGTGAIGVAVLVAASAAVLVLPGDRVEAGTVDVERDGPDVVVRILDLEADADAVRADLVEAGVDEVRIEAVPVASEQAGRFVSLAAPPEVLTLLDPTDAGGVASFTAFRVPRGLSEPIEVFLGRPAAPGEPWATTPSAFRPGGPLACRSLVGRAVADVVASVESGTTRVRWFADDQGPTAPDAVPAHLVYAAVQTADDSITVFVAPELDGVTPMDDRPPGCDDAGGGGG